MSEREFKSGDVVRLHIGSPEMTITRIFDSGNLLCTWFAGGELFNQAFPPSCLVPADEGHEAEEDEELPRCWRCGAPLAWKGEDPLWCALFCEECGTDAVSWHEGLGTRAYVETEIQVARALAREFLKEDTE